jgi:formate-dependent nitrite reductase membrane component NrfD
MKKNRLIFYGFFAFFHLFIFFFSLYLDNQKENFGFLLALQGKIWMLKYGAFIGLVLLGIDITWLLRRETNHEKEIKKLENDMTQLKAKLFDLQEALQKPGSPVEE